MKGTAWACAALMLAACMEPSAPTHPGEREMTLATALATVPSSFSDVQVAAGLTNPTLMAIAPDGRIFVSEQGGTVRVIKNGALLAAPFVSLTVDSQGERGVLGLAFDPAFASNRFVYVYYTSPQAPLNRVSRWVANGDVAGGSEQILFNLPNLQGATNHNGGSIHFGNDGKLYISTGENASPWNSQSITSALGKLLRINSDGSIPTDNPFYGSSTGSGRAIWAMGLRNPYTFAPQPGTGRIFVNDVGQASWEEIDEVVKGANYGWPYNEGSTTDPAYKTPFYTYYHENGTCAITGGDFYNPVNAAFPSDYSGDYFFADYCAGWIRRLNVSTKTVTDFASGISSPTDVRVGDDGALYYVARGSGSIRKITYTGAQTPVISQQPLDITVTAGSSATFTVSASGASPLAYQWQRNQANLAGAIAVSYTLANAQPADNGATFRCVVGNPSGTATSNEAVLTVTSNRPPTAHITAPTSGSTFTGGQVIAYSGTGTDPEDGNLPASAFTWEIRLWHNDGSPHSHPMYGPSAGATSGSFTIPDQGETSANIWYRFYLTVKDAGGLTHRDSVDIQPIKATITLASSPSGLQLKLDGTPVTSPYSFTGVAGIRRSIEAMTPRTSGGKTWTFASWSDGGAAAHTLVTPSTNATLTATYQEAPPQAAYEAEAALFGGPVIASAYQGYTGTGYLDFVNASQDFIEWTVNVPAAGPKALDFRYALGDADTRYLRVSINGYALQLSQAFAPTGSWTTWKTLTMTGGTFRAGTNKVRMTATGTNGPNVDNLGVR